MTTARKSPSRLREVREAQGRSLRSVAKEARIDPASLSRLERGLQRPSVDALMRVGKVLGLRNLTETLALFWESPE
jgi:transcriptional regulator with XRE-family HTH domain